MLTEEHTDNSIMSSAKKETNTCNDVLLEAGMEKDPD
jgi:hypothetical protein